METLVDTPSRHPRYWTHHQTPTQVADHRRSTLPPIGYMESDKRRMDELEAQLVGVRRISKSPPSARYNAPPPLYTPSMPASGSGVPSPPNSRRTSSEEQQPPTQARQPPSLPRLHEALEGVNGMKYPPGAPPPPPPSSQHISTSSFFPTPPAVATSDSARRPFEPQSTYGEAKNSYSSHSTPTTAHHPSPRSNSFPGPSGYSSLPHKAPPVPPIRTGGSPTGSARRPSGPYQPSHPPTPFEPSPQSAPASSYSGYSNYQSTYSYQPETPTGHAPAVLSAPGQFTAGQREQESSDRKPNTPYGESVKRRLDHFQFQTSLCDVSIFHPMLTLADTWPSSSKPRLNCRSMRNSGSGGPTKPGGRSTSPSRSCPRKRSRTSSRKSRC